MLEICEGCRGGAELGAGRSAERDGRRGERWVGGQENIDSTPKGIKIDSLQLSNFCANAFLSIHPLAPEFWFSKYYFA